LRLLLVEDDPGIGRFLRQGLLEAGYEVDWESDGAGGLERARSGMHDLLILDVLLPGISGLELLSGARAGGINSPVLLLTALDTVDDRVRGRMTISSNPLPSRSCSHGYARCFDGRRRMSRRCFARVP
jgi:two-component system copper resistance phosphate regulon response regulator CusR